nr:hypothetical protein OJOKFFHK_00044 [uncultured bacterium]
MRKFMKSREIYSADEEEDEEEEFMPVVPVSVNRSKSPAITQQQAFIKLRDAQKQQAFKHKSAPAAHHGNFGVETASDKKRNLAASETATYEVIRTEKVSPAGRILSGLKSQRDMLVIKEIFDKPLSMRQPD